MGTEREIRLTMRDGVELAATLYLPDDGPQPCLLEALPYRKDDLTSSYAESYVRLRDEFGYAVCRVDLRGTGSSGGDATDEYPAAEQADLLEVIAWLAEQEWCTGNVGMWGTSYSGFNSLQLACERPPALKAICAIYATDDRWTDDVHWRGGALRLIDQVDYNHYMTPMCVLPPVPAVWGEGWRDEWLRRLETNEPWMLTWLRQNRDGDYWRHGSVREAAGNGYDRIEAAVMIVAGWADGYRNNSFRTVEALRAAGTPYRLLAGPWVHADPTTAYPGPRIDLDVEMVAFFDTHLRPSSVEPASPQSSVEPAFALANAESRPRPHEDTCEVFVRTATRPAPFIDQHAGYWVREPVITTTPDERPLDGTRSLVVRPDVGTAAWIDCAGHLPWGLSGDQREDDAHSLTFEWPAAGESVIGHPVVRLRLSADAPLASLSVKLCDVFDDGASALVTRGSLDLTYRDGVHSSPSPLVPGEVYDVEVDLDACAYEFTPGQTIRLSIAGSDWPNTIAPPAPVTLTLHGGSLSLPLHDASPWEPTFRPGADSSNEDPTGVSWTTTRDVLRQVTTCAVQHGSTYDVPYDGTATEEYAGEVVIDNVTFAQHATATATYRLTWPGIDVRVTSRMRIDVEAGGYDVSIETEAYDGDQLIRRKDWTEYVLR